MSELTDELMRIADSELCDRHPDVEQTLLDAVAALRDREQLYAEIQALHELLVDWRESG